MIKFLPMRVLCLGIMLINLSFLGFDVEAKPKCKPLLQTLHNIQALQREGYTLKQGQVLTRKENKARDKWWQCERSLTSSLKMKNRPKKVNKSSKSKYKSQIKAITSFNKKLKPFNQHSAIIIKAKYQGDKRKAWQRFYRQPVMCQQPKTLPIFAYCSENKLQQQALFEQHYTR
jgi:hypothetical protein